MIYKRSIANTIQNDLFKGKAIVLAGARQVGKTTLINSLSYSVSRDNILYINADNPTDRDLFTHHDLEYYLPILSGKDLIIIDEAQRIINIGLTIKILVDHYQSTKQFLLTGSSTLRLLDQTSEPLTGRKFVHHLYPLSYQEIVDNTGELKTSKIQSQLLTYGSYPEIISLESSQEKIRRLLELFDSSLFRDILEFQSIKNPTILHSLLKLLSLQVGSEVSYSELGNLLRVDQKTIEKYVDLLEKSFVVFRLPAYSSHKKREVSKNKKIYFYDLGIRNAAINNFNSLANRDDLGRLWENFVIVERLKYRSYQGMHLNQYFWRTYDGAEIDLVEEGSGQLGGYEIKHQINKKSRAPAKWLEYKNSHFTTITPNSLKGFIY